MVRQNKIIKLIGTDLEGYEDLRFASYLEWCKVYSAYNIPLKVLVNNESLYNWYCSQYNDYVEFAFINDYKNDIEAENNCSDLFMSLFKTYPDTIKEYYPRVLLKMIKKSLKQPIR